MTQPHANGDPIVLSVTSEGSGIYRISGNYTSGGEYILTLMSDEVTFNPEDETLLSYGLTDALRTLRFRVIGESYIEGELSEKVADIPKEEIVVKDSDSITISGNDHNLLGSTEDKNGIIKVGDGDEISNYYKVVAVEATDADGTTYNVRPAEVDEVYDSVSGYEWVDFDGDDLVINEEVLEEVKANLANNEQLNNYVTYLATAATYTSTYAEMSAGQSGEAEAIPLNNTVVTPSGITVGLDFDAYNGNFNGILKEEQRDGFVKLTLGIEYQVKLAKVGSKGTITAQVNMQIDFWVWIGVGGYFEIGWGEYDIDAGMTTLTQTEISFSISLMTSDAKKAVNINDEIEAIYNSAKDPTPENLLEQYNELMSGSSKPIELFNQEIFEMPILSLLYGAVEISVPVDFVVTLDMEATFSSYFTVLTGSDVGLMGNDDDGFDTYYNRMADRFKYRMELRGKVEVRAGIEARLKLSLAYDFASVSLGVQVGFYGEIHGYFFYEHDRMNYDSYSVSNQGGAYYFELGVYVDIRLRAEVCKIKYSGSLWDKKYPFYTLGEKEILYGFVNPTSDVITIDPYQGMVNLRETGIFDVYLYDITEPRSKDNPRKVEDYPFSFSRFDMSLSNDSFEVWYDRIIFRDSAFNGTAFEATLIMNYTGSQLAFRDTLTKYVTIRLSFEDDMDWEKVGETHTIDFTIDGEVIFTREYPYGSTICFEPYSKNSFYLNLSLEQYVKADGTVFTELQQSEQEALYNAGYTEASWSLMKGNAGDKSDVIFVTEDMTIEANKVKRRPWNVTIVQGDYVTPYEVNHGETLKMPSPRSAVLTTPAYAYNFVGWKAENGDIYTAEKEYVITSDLELKMHYYPTARKHLVTFDANGGTIGDGGETFTTQYYYGEMPNYPFTPERAATDTARYEFIGWSPEITKAWTDVTYTAQWKEIKCYTVTFDADEGQFDADGTKTITITVDEGHKLSAADLQTNPYKKATGGYYAFDAWSGVAVGTVIGGNVTFTASYKNTLTAATGITVSDGTNIEDIQAYLDGTNKISGYTYTLNTENYGNRLHITAPGLTVSGEASDINITVTNTEVTLHNLTLTQNERIEVILAEGEAIINISGNVRITSNTDAEAIRGDASGEWDPVNGGYTNYVDANITLRGVDSDSRLTVTGQAYGVAVYGALTVDGLDIDITMPTAAYTAPETGYTYDVVALQVQNHPKGILTVKKSDIVINGGVVNVAWLDMTDSRLTFTAEEFVSGYSNGLHIMNHSALTAPEALITLENSHISFAHDIAIAFAVSLDDGTEYYVNTSLDEHAILSSYSSPDTFLADVSANGYSGMVVMDGNSSIS